MLVFKNHGEAAGTSLVHPHSQIIAAPIVPETVRRSHELAKEHQQRSARCLLCDVLAEEIQGGERMVSRDERFAVFHPFAAARRAETWIVPLQHQAVFQELGDDAAEGFARILGRTLAQLSAAFGDPDFNYAIHSAPRPGAHDPYLHWYLQLIPRMTKAAGFELGSGIFINTSPPEVAAAQMRSAAL
jgi:UDPglucose--hexose-1-phosphate uridylyltransferase